ncbi:MAG TPA: thioesterase family protein [Capillimicrobium sp.]|nr:thioesterase family protein [Capillimicrobium sp.]
MASEVVTAFDRDTAARPLGDGRYRVRFDRGWWVVKGPNGGYLAALIARAIRAEVGDPERALRSLTVHYLAAPREGEGEVVVRVERSGRGLTTVSARLEQDGTTMALALAALARDYPGATEYVDLAMPDVPPPEELDAIPEGAQPVPFSQNFESHPAIGGLPFSGGERAVTGGWIRLREPRPLDELAIVAIADAWWPAPFSVVDRPMVAPTIDLTVHVRAPLPRDHDDVLVDVRSDVARDGFFEEDVRIFARDGTLLAHARQLALLF